MKRLRTRIRETPGLFTVKSDTGEVIQREEFVYPQETIEINAPDDTTPEEAKILRGLAAVMLADSYAETSAEFEVGSIAGEVHKFTATMAVRPETPVEKRIRQLVKEKKQGKCMEVTAEEMAELRALPHGTQ